MVWCQSCADPVEHELSPHPVAKQIIMSHLWPGPSPLSYLFSPNMSRSSYLLPSQWVTNRRYFIFSRGLWTVSGPAGLLLSVWRRNSHILASSGADLVDRDRTISINRPQLKYNLDLSLPPAESFITVLQSTKPSHLLSSILSPSSSIICTWILRTSSNPTAIFVDWKQSESEFSFTSALSCGYISPNNSTTAYHIQSDHGMQLNSSRLTSK